MKFTKSALILASMLFASFANANTYQLTADVGSNVGAVNLLLTTSSQVTDAGVDVTGVSGSFFGSAITNLITTDSADNKLYATTYFSQRGISFNDANLDNVNFSSSGLGSERAFYSLAGATGYNIAGLNNISFSEVILPVDPATAVPEPEAYAMMLAGLGLVGFSARRKLK